MPNRTVQPVHFEDFDGRSFERLVLAYLYRTDNWRSLEWCGQSGGDAGRDIWGVRERDRHPQGQTVCVQCANRRTLPYEKVRDDFQKILGGPNGKPDVFIVIAGGSVSATVRDRMKRLCSENGVHEGEVWSGVEFEERLRARGEALLKRFVEGKPFPDVPADLRLLAQEIEAPSDEEVLALMAGLFDRPAFYTPFHQESSIPAFKKAITDTIEALNTGVHRLRDGTEIRRIPSRHALKSVAARQTLAQIERRLARLRAVFDESCQNGDIRACGCDVPDCPVHFISTRAARRMDRLRFEVLSAFRDLVPGFNVTVGWPHLGGDA